MLALPDDFEKRPGSSVVVQFESVLKGHGFSRAVSIVFSLRL